MNAQTYRAYRAADVAYRDALEVYDAAAHAAYGPRVTPPDALDALNRAIARQTAAYDARENAYRAWMTAGYPRP